MNKKFYVILLAFICLAMSLAMASQDFVKDDGKLFKAATVAELNSRNTALQAKTGKAVYIITLPTLEGKNIQTIADDYFNQLKVNGILILLSMKEHAFRLKLGNNTDKLFQFEQVKTIKNEILQNFRQGKFDEGILNGYGMIETVFLTNGASIVSTKVLNEATNQDKSGNTKWIVIMVFIILGIWLFRLISRGMSAGSSAGTPGTPGTPGMPGTPGIGGGGGGFLSGLLGGLGGAFLGNALYDNFSGHHRDDSNLSDSGASDSSAGSQPDTGSGYDVGGSWDSGDNQVADSGGDLGGGFDGGGDFGGGGDW
jgi:uncharacterized membrane protein YgcG